MNTQNKLEELKKFIQKQIPSILELKFGCEIEREGKKCLVVSDLFISEFNHCEGFLHLWEDELKDSIENYLMTREFPPEEKNGGDWEYDFKIIGRPITLEDVLIVLERKSMGKGNRFYISHNGNFFRNDEPISEATWEFGKSFNNQSKEFYDWLYELLIENK